MPRGKGGLSEKKENIAWGGGFAESSKSPNKTGKSGNKIREISYLGARKEVLNSKRCRDPASQKTV